MSARGAAACALLFAWLSPAGAALGQSGREIRFEGGSAVVRQQGRDSRPAAVAGAFIQHEARTLAALLSTGFTWAGDSVTAAQAIAAAAWRPAAESPWHTEGGATGAAFGTYPVGRGGSASGYLRERAVFSTASLWVGGAFGNTVRDDESWHSTSVEFGGTLRSGGFEAGITYARLRTNDIPLMEASGIFLSIEAEAHDLEDVVFAASYERGPLTLAATETFRGGIRKSLARQVAFRWTAEYELNSRLTLSAAGGRMLADPVRGVPDATVMSLVLRVLLYPWRVSGERDAAARSVARITTADSTGAVLVVRVPAPADARVEIAGSFSGWAPVPVIRSAGMWEAQVVLKPGTHRVAVRVNDGRWRAPANLGRMRDEFGGEAGVVVVP